MSLINISCVCVCVYVCVCTLNTVCEAMRFVWWCTCESDTFQVSKTVVFPVFTARTYKIGTVVHTHYTHTHTHTYHTSHTQFVFYLRCVIMGSGVQTVLCMLVVSGVCVLVYICDYMMCGL